MSRGSKYTKDDLEAAISEVIAGEMTQAEASLQYSIPKATLSDHIGRRTGKENKRSGLGVRGASSALAAQENVVDGMKTVYTTNASYIILYNYIGRIDTT